MLYTKKFLAKDQAHTTIVNRDTTEGTSLETQIAKILANKEPIPTTDKMLYTDKKDGVHAGYDIRTDRFEVAIDATDRITGALVAKRQQEMKAEKEPKQAEPTEQAVEPKTE